MEEDINTSALRMTLKEGLWTVTADPKKGTSVTSDGDSVHGLFRGYVGGTWWSELLLRVVFSLALEGLLITLRTP